MNIIKQNWLGLIGLIILCIGIVLPQGLLQNICNISGISSLILYAWYGKNDFFFYLESVVLLGTILQIMHINLIVMTVILVIAAIFSFYIIFRNPIYRTKDIVFGIIGVAGLIYGYATLSNVGYAIGGIGALIYSFIGFSKGIKSALIFTLLNAIYSATAIYMIVAH